MRQSLVGVAVIAAACHEANRHYCRSIGDDSQPAWDDAPEWQRASALDGVMKILSGAVKTPEQSHQNWWDMKIAEGWKFGPVKDAEKKEHPCMVPYEQLAPEQRMKDTIFHGIVRAMTTGITSDRFGEDRQMHHSDGWYFRRQDDHAVRVQVRSGLQHEMVEHEHLIPRNEWESIVRHVEVPR